MPTTADLETKELVHRLVNMPGYSLLGNLIEEKREESFTTMARALASSPTEVDQRKIDYQRGFWQGALWATRRLPKQLAKDWDVLVAAAEEGEDTV